MNKVLSRAGLAASPRSPITLHLWKCGNETRRSTSLHRAGVCVIDEIIIIIKIT